MAKKRQNPKPGTCHATAKSGKPCAAPAIRDANFCSLHVAPGRAAELGRQGGRKNRSPVPQLSVEPIVAPAGPAAIFQTLGQAYSSVFAGSMSPKVGATLAFMANQLLKAYELSILADSVNKMEALNCEVSELAKLPAPPPPKVIVQRPSDEEFDRAVEPELNKLRTASW